MWAEFLKEVSILIFLHLGGGVQDNIVNQHRDRAMGWAIWVSNPTREKIFVSSPIYPDHF